MKIPYGVALVAFLLTATPAIADYQYYNNDRGGGYYYETQPQRNNSVVRPSIGLDYVYSDVELGKLPDEVPHKLNSFDATLGLKFGRYIGLEAFIQKSADTTKTVAEDLDLSSSFYAYGLDLNIYAPIMSDKVDFLVALGGAEYRFEEEIEPYSPMHMSFTEKEDCFGIRAGLGLQFYLSDRVAIRALGRYVWLNSDYLDYIKEFTIGGRVYF